MLCLILNVYVCTAQSARRITLFQNSTLYLSDASKQKAIVTFLEDYLNEVASKSPQRYYAYWGEQIISEWTMPDYVLWHIEYDSLLKDARNVRPVLLAAQEVAADTFEAKIAFIHSDSASASINIQSIFNFILRLSPTPQLIPQVDYYTRQWRRTTIDSVSFVYPTAHEFIEDRARQLVALNDSLASFFSEKPMAITYYISPDQNAMYRINGFDFQSLMFLKNQYGGFADLANWKIFAGNDSEYYPHELVHLYSWRKFGKNISRFYDEGLATYLGGSVGNDFDWHVRNIALYMDHHELDFDKLIRCTAGETNFDDQTNVQYALGALLCDYIEKQHGIDGLFRFLEKTGANAKNWNYTADFLGIELKDLGKFMKDEVCKYKSPASRSIPTTTN